MTKRIAGTELRKKTHGRKLLTTWIIWRVGVCLISIRRKRKLYERKGGQAAGEKNRIQLYEGHRVSLPIHSVQEEVTHVQTFHFFFLQQILSLKIFKGSSRDENNRLHGTYIGCSFPEI